MFLTHFSFGERNCCLSINQWPIIKIIELTMNEWIHNVYPYSPPGCYMKWTGSVKIFPGLRRTRSSDGVKDTFLSKKSSVWEEGVWKRTKLWQRFDSGWYHRQGRLWQTPPQNLLLRVAVGVSLVGPRWRSLSVCGGCSTFPPFNAWSIRGFVSVNHIRSRGECTYFPTLLSCAI